MKIVFITPLLTLGGGQRYVTQLANYWSETGHSISIIVLRKKEIFYDINKNINLIELNYSSENKVHKLFTGWRVIFEIRRIIKQINPEFVLSILSTTNILTLVSTLFLNNRVYIRDAFSQSRKRNIFDKIGRKLFYGKADGIIAQSEEIKKFIEHKLNCKKIKVLPNPVRKIEPQSMVKKEKIILNVARLHGYKGQKYLIEACSKIKYSGWKFVILGEGPLREKLEKQIANLGIKDKIEMPGAVKNIDEWLLKSSIFVFPSILEGLPNALIEAMTAGLPCISFDCETGPRDLINNGENGFLLPVGDLNLLVKRIEQLINDKDLREKFSFKAKVTTEKFHIDNVADEVLNFCTNNSVEQESLVNC